MDKISSGQPSPHSTLITQCTAHTVHRIKYLRPAYSPHPALFRHRSRKGKRISTTSSCVLAEARFRISEVWGIDFGPVPGTSVLHSPAGRRITLHYYVSVAFSTPPARPVLPPVPSGLLQGAVPVEVPSQESRSASPVPSRRVFPIL